MLYLAAARCRGRPRGWRSSRASMQEQQDKRWPRGVRGLDACISLVAECRPATMMEPRPPHDADTDTVLFQDSASRGLAGVGPRHGAQDRGAAGARTRRSGARKAAWASKTATLVETRLRRRRARPPTLLLLLSQCPTRWLPFSLPTLLHVLYCRLVQSTIHACGRRYGEQLGRRREVHVRARAAVDGEQLGQQREVQICVRVAVHGEQLGRLREVQYRYACVQPSITSSSAGDVKSRYFYARPSTVSSSVGGTTGRFSCRLKGSS